LARLSLGRQEENKTPNPNHSKTKKRDTCSFILIKAYRCVFTVRTWVKRSERQMWTRVCILGNVRVTSLVNRATRDRTRTVCARSYRSFLQSLRFDSSLDYSSSLVLTTPRSIERLNMNEEEERFFCAGRWKHARIFAIVHLVFEVIGFFMLIASGFSYTWTQRDPFWLSSVKVSPSAFAAEAIAVKALPSPLSR